MLIDEFRILFSINKSKVDSGLGTSKVCIRRAN